MRSRGQPGSQRPLRIVAIVPAQFVGLHNDDDRRGEIMRLFAVCAALAGVALPAAIPSAHAAGLPAAFARPAAAVVHIGARRERQRRDCQPYNGPFGFYGNIWCQPPSPSSYVRNLGAGWPMDRPQALKMKKPSTARDW
jgi:hypothetical protein